MATNNNINYGSLSAGLEFIGRTAPLGPNSTSGITAGGTYLLITAVSGSTTLNVNSGGFAYSTTSGAISANQIKVSTGGSLVTFNIPTSPVLGQTFVIQGQGSGGWTLSISSATVQVGSRAATTSVSSTNQYDAMTCSCIQASPAIWGTREVQGDLTVI